MLLTFTVGACASRTARPEPFPRPHAPVTERPAPEPAPAIGEQVVQAALALRGRPYAPGGSGPERFDCSGLVQYVYSQAGVALPRTVTAQFETTSPIERDAVRAGDLLFFRMVGGKPSHVAIAIGDGSFVHAPSSRGTVRVEQLSAPYWRQRFEGARRVE